MSVQEHVCEVVSDFLDGGWTAMCSCGWEGDLQRTAARAVTTWEDHCDTVFYEATS